MKTQSLKTKNEIWIGIIGFVFLMLIAIPSTAFGQQWTGPDANGNISNTNSGNVGVGTTSPSAVLHVKGGGSGILIERNAAEGGGAIIQFKNSLGDLGFIGRMNNAGVSASNILGLSANGSNYHLSILPNGNVGIGTTAPALKLDVRTGTVNDGAAVVNTNPITGGSSPLFLAVTNSSNTVSNTSIESVSNSGGTADLFIRTGATSATGFGTPRIVVLGANGNVGIGTTSPGSKLSVESAGLSSGGFVDFNLGESYAAYKTAILRYTNGAGTAANSKVMLFNGGDNSDTGITIIGGGNVGIGTTTPGYKLEVNGEINATGLRINGTPISSGGGSSQWTGTSNIYYNGGNVGIGTNTPAGKLHVSGNTGSYTGLFLDDTATGGRQYGIESTDSANGIGGGKFAIFDGTAGVQRLTIDSGGNVGIGTTTPGQKLQIVGGQLGVFNSASTGGATIDGGAQFGATSIFSDYLAGSEPKLHLSTYSGRATTAGITIDTGGNVGIGKTTPTAALDVTGDIKVSGNISAKYQDVAEWVPSSEKLSAGTVVILDSTKSNQVISSTQSYDTRVAGVISEQPGIALGEKSDSKVLVATTGRVRVRVDASRAPIRIGDLLVTSDIPGVAMKSEPVNLGSVQIHRPGTLIGKALEPLEKGSGEILVLLSLQ